jgi:hypothetical protein
LVESYLAILTIFCGCAATVVAQTNSYPLRWSLPGISRLVLPGQQGFEIVDLTSNISIDNVVVEVTPSLQNVLTVEPSRIARIEVGRTYRLVVKFAIPLGLGLNSTIDGTLHIRSATGVSKTWSKPLPVTLTLKRFAYKPGERSRLAVDPAGGTFLTNRIVVEMAEGSGLSEATQVALTQGANVVGASPQDRIYEFELDAGSTSSLDAAISRIAASPQVSAAMRSYLIATASTDLENLKSCHPTFDVNIYPYERIKTVEAWRLARQVVASRLPARVAVGILDSSIDRTHPEFRGVDISPAHKLLSANSLLMDHGTKVSSIIAASDLGPKSCAPLPPASDAEMTGLLGGLPQPNYFIDFMGNEILTNMFQLGFIVGAIDSFGSSDTPVVNMSLGSPKASACYGASTNLLTCLSQSIGIDAWDSYRRILSRTFKKYPSTLFVLAAGNYGLDATNVLPAAVASDAKDNVLVVGATNALDARPSFSGHGDVVGLAAPGTDIYVARPYSPPLDTNDYEPGSGTSFSAPLVTGTAAIVRSLEGFSGSARMSTKALKSLLISSGDPGPVDLGGKRLNVCRAVRNAMVPNGFSLKFSEPLNGTTGVPLTTAAIRLEFSAPLTDSALTSVQFKTESGQVLSGSYALSPDGRTLTFTPYSPLSPGTRYTADFGNTSDVCGDRLPIVFVYSFTTAGATSQPPTCTLSATPQAINPGQSSTLSWKVSNNPTAGSIAPGIGPVNLLTPLTVSPTQSTTYTLTVSNAAGSETCSALVSVNQSSSDRYSLTGSLNYARVTASATLLKDGRVLIAGGHGGNNNQPTETAEIYDPSTGQFTLTGFMNVARWGHSAVLLDDGRVWIVGGNKTCCQDYPGETEFFDPSTGTFSFGPTLSNELGGSATSSVPLVKDADGTVLIVNGYRRFYGPIQEVWRFDPRLNSLAFAGNTLYPHAPTQGGIARLRSGKILVAAGGGGTQSVAELYDPVSNTSRLTAGQMPCDRDRPASAVAGDGRVVIAGGNPRCGPQSVMLFDPVSEAFSSSGQDFGAELATAVALPGGRVLITGGEPGSPIKQGVFDPAANLITSVPATYFMRSGHTATLLENGQVLIVGGMTWTSEQAVPVASRTAELFASGQ